MTSQFHVGQRLSYESALCTVRYIGPVAGTQKDWLGVEWDDPTRGKHNGEHNGVRYFECKSTSQTAASFVRPSRTSDPPQSFVEAVHEKYASELAEQEQGKSAAALVEISGKVVEEVGFDKIRRQLAQLQELKIVLVDGLRVVKAETESQLIKDVCPKIVELDISRNLFETATEIIKICERLRLRILKLNGNRIAPLSEDLYSSATKAFEGIAELSIDDTLWSWAEICAFSQRFESLKALSCSSNDLSQLTPSCLPSSSLSSLTTLTLEYNNFTSLSDISVLVGLPSLESLHLKGNQISRVRSPDNFDAGRETVAKFDSRLRYVDLSFNSISSWAFVDALPDVFPGLTALRLSHNPVYDGGSSVDVSATSITSVDLGYMFTLARLANLKTLNFSNISPAERTNAEMFYLSQIGKALSAVPEEQEPSVLSQHRRYHELCSIYGEPAVVRSGAKTINPNFLEARLIAFTFYLPANAVSTVGEIVTKTKEVPRGFDIYKLKGIVGRLFGLKPMRLRLIWETGEWDPVAGYEDDEMNSSDEEEDSKVDAADEEDASKESGKWMKREVELVDSTRQVGHLIDGTEATVRVELR